MVSESAALVSESWLISSSWLVSDSAVLVTESVVLVTDLSADQRHDRQQFFYVLNTYVNTCLLTYNGLGAACFGHVKIDLASLSTPNTYRVLLSLTMQNVLIHL